MHGWVLQRSNPISPVWLKTNRQVDMASILVVEDYEDTAVSMAMWLKLHGHSVQIARNGYQAIEIASGQAQRVIALHPCRNGPNR